MANYSAPMPAIGLYIAGASSACFIFLFFDILSGFRSRKPWLPCRLFSLNSLTLSLLAVATKLLVDLTTPMPSALDQLSKLIGTTLICISMAFFLPSLGTMSESEGFSNLAALTIFVVTVMVNICIQISTGAIFSFIVEHTLILFFMLLLLAFLWVLFFLGAKLNDWFSDGIRDCLIKGEESSMMDRLVLCHVDCYYKNPQRLRSDATRMRVVGTLSALCTMVLCEALLRSLVFKKMSFHGGDSDYKWSMWVVVVSQILTVLLGFMGILFRWINSDNPEGGTDMDLESILTLRCNVKFTILTILFLLFVWPIFSLSSAYVKMMKRIGIMQHEEVDQRDAAQKQCREEMERWKEVLKTKSPTHLMQLFSETHPSQTPFSNYIKRFYETHKSRLPDQHRVSCLSIVFLTQEAANKLEREVVARSLVSAFDEVFEIIYFIDKKMSASILERDKAKVAKELWTKIWDLSNLHDYASWKPLDDVNDDFFRQEKSAMQLLIKDVNDVIDDFNNNIQQLFVDMLCSFLAKLPLAIIKDVTENQLGDQEKNIKRAIQYLMKLEKLEDVIQWEFPSETNITNLITPRQQASSSGATVHQYAQVAVPHQLMAEHEVILEVPSVHGASIEIEEIG